MNKIKFILLTQCLCFTSCNNNVDNYLVRPDWCSRVKDNLNAFIKKNKNTDNYVVFDFDNTSSIFDVEEQSIIYQIKNMAFNVTPEEMPNILATSLNLDKKVERGTYREWINDISSSYAKLYNNPSYGPFSYQGLSEEKMKLIQQEDDWKNFASKLRALYNVIDSEESSNISYPWVTYLFTGMKGEEVYSLGSMSHSTYKDVNTYTETITSPNIGVGSVEVSFSNGISVTPNIVELMKELNNNGIDVWICSASNIDLIRAAVDVFGLHDYVTGVLAMTNKEVNDKMVNEYDYNACPYIAKPNKKWEKDSYVMGAQPHEKGKVTAINNTLVKKYSKGPIAGFMDASGDFNFCTEYKSLQLVTCFNRANRGITDGGGLIAAIAMYQQETLHLNFNDTFSSGDTLYLLQGREENGLRSFRNSNKTMRLGETNEKLFKNDDNYTLLNYMVNNKKEIKEYINTFAIKTPADNPNNPLGLTYGFLTSYSGYHSL